MNKFLKYTIVLAIITIVIGLTGCTRERPELPGIPTSTPTQAIPLSLDGTPTILAVNATATPAPVLGTPTPVVIAATATPMASAAGNNTELIPTATATPGSSPAGDGTSSDTTTGGSEIIHIVQPGENLYRIGLKYNIDAATIAAYNGISNITLIYVGQSLRIPTNGTTTPGGGSTYIVQPGDTLYTIATIFNTTVQALMSANGITDPNTIYIGQTLSIP